MKVYSFIICVFLAVVVHGQKSQNEILGYPEISLTKDYGFFILGGVAPVEVLINQYDQRQSSSSKEINTSLQRTINLKFNTSRNIKTKTVLYQNKRSEYTYTYNSKRELIEHKNPYNLLKIAINKDVFVIKTIYPNSTLENSKTYTKYKDGYLIDNGFNKDYYQLNSRLVTKSYLKYKDENTKPSYLYTYDNNRRLISYKSTDGSIKSKYSYNKNGDVATAVEETNYSRQKIRTNNYAYHYDTYGNWIVKVDLLNLSYAMGIPSFPNPTIRKITYSNGDITGYKDITSEVENILKTLRLKVKTQEQSNASTSKYTWKKINGGKSFWLYEDGKSIANECINFYIKDHLICFNTKTKALYELTNFVTKEENKNHIAKLRYSNCKNGFWYKTEKNTFYAYNDNGKLITKLKFSKWSKDGKDFIIQGENQKYSVSLNGFKTAIPFKIYKAEHSSEYVKRLLSSVKESKKRLDESMAKVLKGELIKGNNTNGYGEVKLIHNQIYEGFFKDGKPQGAGLLYNTSKQVYTLRDFNGLYNDKNYRFLYQRDNNGEMLIDAYRKEGYYFNSKENIIYRLVVDSNMKITKKTQMTSTGKSTGCILGNCYNGLGVYIYNDKSSYTGFFSNNKRHSCGKLSFSNGDLYLGEFQNGKKTGTGEYDWKDGKYYRGEWKNDLYHGEGVMFFSNDKYQSGIWENGKFTGSYKSSY
ncbi:MORN repeat-containing protein [Seonamhaeicola marinus]|uniref:Uncharacterized protein n=1 Tax=Seonamhaeicola marinus TaxID=1912246 RepID=A0A5D0HSG7_9FLAO|nr:hypothetical protein [Seonamhaeicola marinus]TYA74195.1 hypothetical protein FUA24_12735 [Seonamhaeicola marinus]